MGRAGAGSDTSAAPSGVHEGDRWGAEPSLIGLRTAVAEGGARWEINGSDGVGGGDEGGI